MSEAMANRYDPESWIAGNKAGRDAALRESRELMKCGHPKSLLSNLDDHCGEPECEAETACTLCFAQSAYKELATDRDEINGLRESLRWALPLLRERDHVWQQEDDDANRLAESRLDAAKEKES